MKHRSRSSDSLKTTRSLIDGLFSSLGIKDKIEQHRVWSIWEQAVGPQVALHTTPIRIRNNILEIKVDHPVWMQQLQLLKPRLLVQINAHLGQAPISDLFLRRGELAVRQVPAPAPPLDLPELSAAEQQSIHQLTAAIQDPEVRLALEELLQKQRRLHKKQQATKG